MADQLGELESFAVRALAAAARELGQMKPRRNATGPYGRALTVLFEKAQAWCTKSDEEWAREVAELKQQLEDVTFERDQLQAYKDRNPL